MQQSSLHLLGRQPQRQHCRKPCSRSRLLLLLAAARQEPLVAPRAAAAAGVCTGSVGATTAARPWLLQLQQLLQPLLRTFWHQQTLG
jgi:hypothetical protein